MSQGFQILFFLFANGDRITDFSKECFDKAKSFIEELIGEYENADAMAMDDASLGAIADRYSTSHSEVFEMCGQFTDGPSAAAVGSRVNFIELIRFLLANKDQITDLVNWLTDLFGGGQSTTAS